MPWAINTTATKSGATTHDCLSAVCTFKFPPLGALQNTVLGSIASVGSVYIKLNDNPPEQSCRPAADVLFRSMPSVWGREVLAVVLTGMGADGTAGCKSVVEAGGSVIAQDTETSVVWGMPGSAVRAGVVETVIPLEEIHQEIEQRVKNGRLR